MNKRSLNIGMIFQQDINWVNWGQASRDTVRCQGQQAFGMEVYSLDTKHDSIPGRHFRTSVNNFQNMWDDMVAEYGLGFTIQFLILDWYFSPNSWIRDRFNEKFFSETIPKFAVNRILLAGDQVGKINISFLINICYQNYYYHF